MLTSSSTVFIELFGLEKLKEVPQKEMSEGCLYSKGCFKGYLERLMSDSFKMMSEADLSQ